MIKKKLPDVTDNTVAKGANGRVPRSLCLKLSSGRIHIVAVSVVHLYSGYSWIFFIHFNFLLFEYMILLATRILS